MGKRALGHDRPCHSAAALGKVMVFKELDNLDNRMDRGYCFLRWNAFGNLSTIQLILAPHDGVRMGKEGVSLLYPTDAGGKSQ